MWKCKCSCGNEFITSSNHILSGHTTSCGCFHKEKLKQIHRNLIGCKFGRLTVIERITGDFLKRTTWLCECECGKKCTATSADLKSGRKKSCGCLVSSAEDEFADMLLKNGVSFVRQFSFDGCKYKRKLPFDFAIFNNGNLELLVELNVHHTMFSKNSLQRII